MIDGHGARMESKAVTVDLRQALVLLHHALCLVAPLLGSLVENQNQVANGAAHNTSPHNKPRPPEERQTNGAGLSAGLLIRSPIDPDSDYDLHFVAKQLGKSTASVRKKVNNGDIVAVKVGKGKGQFFVKGSELIKHTSTMTTYS
jgi:hypothetical protein